MKKILKSITFGQQKPNFCEQKLLLEEALVNARHIFEKYSKYYCKYNFIERY
ncbi:16788_t:CDS:2 [Cetraspora pellucida]|uniref:16788_t:CDS:1 n=1 Tax=Cetraspora pellucida TaxID=1433469 RepID=A0A9N9HRV2_9GLOM|nr:16788_t:CDS:2 [Cetraspora pellucida]